MANVEIKDVKEKNYFQTINIVIHCIQSGVVQFIKIIGQPWYTALIFNTELAQKESSLHGDKEDQII